MLQHDLERSYQKRLSLCIDRLRGHDLLNEVVAHRGRRRKTPMGHRLAGTPGGTEPDEELLRDIARLITPGVLGRDRALTHVLDAVFADLPVGLAEQEGAFQRPEALFPAPPDDVHLQIFTEHGALRVALRTAVSLLQRSMPPERGSKTLLHELRVALMHCLQAYLPSEVPEDDRAAWKVVDTIYERLREARVLNVEIAASTAVGIGEMFGFEIEGRSAADAEATRAGRFLRRRRRARRREAVGRSSKGSGR